MFGVKERDGIVLKNVVKPPKRLGEELLRLG